jgi:ssDNA-binding Zn-finger/Zn-ribbon topoisomerase 1
MKDNDLRYEERQNDLILDMVEKEKKIRRCPICNHRLTSIDFAFKRCFICSAEIKESNNA